MDESHGVIATGGGAFVDPATRALVLERGIAVWIDCDTDTLVERTSRRPTRPLLQQGDPHFAQSRDHVSLGQRALFGQAIKYPTKAV